MTRRTIYVGERAGRLVATQQRNPGEPRVQCLCDCGKAHSVSLGEWGRTQSCGCLRGETNTRVNSTHGMSKTPEYRVWAHVIGRCCNPNDQDFAEYGGRGITVAEVWRSFERFYADMGPRPEGTSLDRIDVNGNYEPGNCRWATAEEQANNRRARRLATHCGNGHEWNDENTRHHANGTGRTCRACHRANEAQRRDGSAA